MKQILVLLTCLSGLSGLLPAESADRDVRAEIKRAEELGRKMGSLMQRNQLRPFWAEDGSSMIYRINTAAGQHRFYRVDLKSGARTPAFDHEVLAKALAEALSRQVNQDSLPLEGLDFDTTTGTIRFRAFDKGWRFAPQTRELREEDVQPKSVPLLSPEETMRKAGVQGPATSLTIENGTDGVIELFWVESRRERKSYGKIPAGQSNTLGTYAGHAWVLADASGRLLAGLVAEDAPSFARVTGKVGSPPQGNSDQSPDGKWRARIREHNVQIEPTAGGAPISVTTDGRPGHPYTGPLLWSPDSRKLSARRVKEVPPRKIHIVESSPSDQLQPKLLTLDYPKPGDDIERQAPLIIDIASRRPISTDPALFDNPWSIGDEAWADDSSELTFVYNQRGHQVMRVVGIHAETGTARSIHEERSKTFIDYSQKYYHHRLRNSRDFIWASERSGFNHLYRIDATAGTIRNPITSGDWNVREVIEVDEEKARLLIKVNGMPGSDPYHEHFIRVNLDGSGFTRLTASDGMHQITFSPDRRWILATWSRVDQAPVVEIRDAETGDLLTELERADDRALREAGWNPPERFVAKGRDGKTGIHGVIVRPTHFDPAKSYPVVEDIYAGPHDYFVPKRFSPWSGLHAMAELGFIVVKIDGMGTNWRSKAFHDVSWKNLKDSGFPDRIAWIKSAAATRPWMDLSRVGIFGGSAGGQSTLSGLLHHGDFYQVGVADCGCHDNRMDKIWWNEAWMGWPVDDSYEQSSNVFHAPKLKGKLMLIVGELDSNVDPASTAQVVAALQKAGKTFDYVPIMGAGHGAAESPYGKFRRADFLIRHLQP